MLGERRLLESVHDWWEENSMVIGVYGEQDRRCLVCEQEGDLMRTWKHGGGMI